MTARSVPQYAKTVTRSAVRCPRCRLVIAPRMPMLAPDYCPRCLARRHLAVKLESVPLGVVDRIPAPAQAGGLEPGRAAGG